jgi:signal transduction histidine kinase
VESQSIAIYDEAGKAVGMRGVTMHISRQKRAEELQVRDSQRKALQSDISAVLRLNGSLNEILQRYAQTLLQNLNLALVGIWALSKDKNTLELCAEAKLINNLKENYARVSIGDTEIGKIAEQRKPHLTNDVQNDSRISRQDWIKKEGIIAFAGYPLMVENRLVGVMAIFARVRLNEDTLEELAAFADNVAQIIERRRLEQALIRSEIKLRQYQRLESIGKWAGGIAHDFNNMLTVINGYSELSLRRLRKDGPLRSNIEEIKKAGEQSALLTYQLLVFSRQQRLKPETVNLNEVIGEIDNMLHRLINKDIQLIINLDNNLGYVKADWEQLSHLVMNLAVNARDAMPHGGTLTIETKNFIADDKSIDFDEQNVPVKPGTYITLIISYAGISVDKTRQQHLFEPFYDSKETNPVNGLGLAMVHDIVEQTEGYIFVDNDGGNEATFRIYLPQIDKEAKSSNSEQAFEQIPQQKEIC